MRFAIRSPDIRTRLTLWFTLILTLLLGAFAYAVYQINRDSLIQQTQQDVRQRATLIAAADPTLAQTVRQLPKTDVFNAPDVFVQIVSPTGKVLATSSNLGQWRLPFLPAAIRADQVKELRIGGMPFYIYGHAASLNGQLTGYVLVARSPSTIYLAINRLGAILMPGVPIALIVAGLAGWLLIRRSMRPLERLSRAAGRIAQAHDHTQRVGYVGPRDEIGRLASTIDSMLASLEEAHRQLGALNTSQRRFLADVSHELRTPLTIMLSTLDLLAKPGASDQAFQARALHDMRVEANRMARMVTQLLIMARSESGFTLPAQPILIADTVADACRQVTPNGSGVTLESRGLESLGDAVVKGDPDYLKQLFLILLDNAVKYTTPGGHVDVTGALDGDTVTVTVADTGMGIPPAELDKIFDRFYRAENARTQDGMGLGLSIAQQIASQHGGSIAVDSEPGHGSRFTVTLPLFARQAVEATA
jgi:two-component system, OmpR family, sensor kinase